MCKARQLPCELWQGRQTGADHREIQPGDSGGDDVSTTETKCAKWRRESIPVRLTEKGFEAPFHDDNFVSI
jgi:hypothetical protein